MKQTCLLVAGMHRSGTSALTGVLSMLDVYLGNEIMPENNFNKKGYFENNILYPINDKLLYQMDSSWDDVFFHEEKISNVKNIDELKNEIKKEFEYSNIFAIKDPRIAFLFPVYKRVLEELEIDVKVIIPFRNPMEVARSLNIRNNFSYEKGMLLWVYHFLLAEKYSREFERVFLGFNDLMSNPKGVVTLISEKLHINLDEKYSNNSKQIIDFLEPGLKHHNISVDNLSKITSKVVREILHHQDEFNDDVIFGRFDALREEFFGYKKLFYNQDIVNAFADLKVKSHSLVETEQALQQRTEESEQSKQQFDVTEQILHQRTEELEHSKQQFGVTEQMLHQRTEELEQSKQQLGLTEQGLHQRTEELEQSKQQLSKTEHLLHQRTEELEQSKQQLNEKEQILFQRNQEINAFKDELITIYTGRSWKITRPLRKLKRIFK